MTTFAPDGVAEHDKARRWGKSLAVLSSTETRWAEPSDIDALRRRGDVPGWLSLGLPGLTIGFILLLMLVAALRLTLLGQSAAFSPAFLAVLRSERGPLELGTSALALIAAMVALRALLAARRGGAPLWLLGWIGANCLGALYFAGEEVSWGQHLVRWQTTGWFAANNDQLETNLHNISSWLDQKPRLLLFIWCVVGGIVVPLVERRRGLFRSDSWSYWIWPTRACLAAGIAVLIIRIPEDLIDLAATPLDSAARAIFTPINLTEVQEFLYAVFILVFMVSLMRRVLARFG